MRILKLYDGDYPWDVRVEKMLRTLTGAGHQVTLLARNKGGRPRREVLSEPEGVRIRRLPHGGRAEPVFGAPVPFHPVWVREALAVARESRPDRILARDLPLAPLALWLARRLRVPAVLDFAEPYPEALRSNWQFDAPGGLDHVLRSPRLAEWVERRVLGGQPRILVVCDEAGARLEGRGLRPDRWTVVGNTPELARLDAALAAAGGRTDDAASPLDEVDPDRPIRLLFSGILVGDRGLEVAMEGMAKRTAAGARPDVKLSVIGEGPARARYEARARALGLEDRVRFLGWVPHAELPAHWARANVGLLPFHRCSHIDHTLANKLFDYMAVGLPVIASDAPPMVRVLRETGAGEIFAGGDAADFARALEALLSDRRRMREMGERGRTAVRERYAWEHDAVRLLEAVEHP